MLTWLLPCCHLPLLVLVKPPEARLNYMTTSNFVRVTIAACAAVCLVSSLSAQSTGFSAGNLVISRSVYQGTAATLAVGQPLPPVCPSTGSCASNGGPATASGAYPSLASTNNVWNNNLIDGSFGITSPIFLDQVNPAGILVNTLAIPPTMVNTSFSSKSELALNLSADGTAITFMAYVAPTNQVDVSDANTPMIYDPTNPAGGSYYRSVVQVGANGAIQVTPTNSYSGNNGRAAALAGGLYYMVGNANNGSGTPANVIASAGAQIATPGQALATMPTEIGDFSISQVINPVTGLPYAPDKAGKDNNFRGLTIYNNTMYVTKGSGSNGFNVIYQVGDKGSLPTVDNAASAALTPLPGYPVVSAKATSGVMYPFGLFFANATTLYVGDEGDGTTTNAATSRTSGLQKWVYSNGQWTLAYVLQNGLNLGQPYAVANYPASLNPATDGLRNITGKINGDGTVTIYGVTSTVSANGDAGADPNMIVAITDTIANTTASAAASEKFTVFAQPSAGTVYRGICLSPSAGSTPAVNVPLILSAASPSATAIAPGSLATASGQNLATGVVTGTAPFQTTLSGASVTIVDSTGASTSAKLLAVSANQITFYVPTTVAAGTAQVTVSNGTVSQVAGNVEIATAAPGLLTLNGNGLAAAYAVQVSSTGAQTVLPVYTTNSSGAVVASPIPLSGGTTYLVLFGTGIAGGGTALTSATINGVSAPVIYAGSQGGENGLDQVNIQIPASLAGKGNVNVQLTTEGIAANPVQITVQ
jgi:uncharacterized protein (TIGR03437 family)